MDDKYFCIIDLITQLLTAEDSRLAEKAKLIEHYIYQNSNFTVNKHYKDTTRSKIWNLKDKKNPELRHNVAEGLIKEEEFAQMDAEVTYHHVLNQPFIFFKTFTFYKINVNHHHYILST